MVQAIFQPPRQQREANGIGDGHHDNKRTKQVIVDVPRIQRHRRKNEAGQPTRQHTKNDRPRIDSGSSCFFLDTDIAQHLASKGDSDQDKRQLPALLAATGYLY